MTQEENVRAYDEALSVALETYKTQPTYRDWLEKMFPELKESDDEKIRKALIEMVHDTTGDSLWVDYNVHKEDAIAWLEKQANHANFRNKIEVGDKVTRNRDGVLVNLSQLNRVAKVEEKQGEQKSDDKVEPKFNVDDFILNGDVTDDGKPEIFKVLNVQDTWYAVENIYDGRNTIITFKQDSSCRLWDLTKDAKDGDFLVCKSDKQPFIFKGFDRFHPDCPVAYCGICADDSFQVSSGDGWWTGEEVFPATKEQREQLLKAIADAGYMWDAENKQLKEIEQKFDIEIPFEAKDSELQEWSYSIPEGFHAEIKDNKVFIKKGEQKPTDAEMKTLLQTEYEKGRADAIAEMQKSWSEEDERNLKGIIDEIEANKNHAPDYDVATYDRFLSWLKSLRPQWKPSEEQIEILDMVLTNESMDDNIARILRELREQLKKLKGE